VGNDSITAPVIAALAIGIAFVILFALFMTPMSAAITRERPPIQQEFKRAEQLQEVQLFVRKYPDFTSGFSQNSTAITYHYEISRWGDADGDGYDESFRRLTLSATFEGNGFDIISKDATISGLKQIQIRCDAASIENRTLYNFIPPMYGEENVMNFLQSGRCIEFSTSHDDNNNDDDNKSYSPLTLTIEGFKSTYQAGKEIDFIVKVSGYGRLCTYPNVAIQNVNTKQVVWYSRSPIGYNCEPAHDINEEFHARDIGINRGPLILNETGPYRLGASIQGEGRMMKYFEVVN
jgi:hypothetical protein